MLVKHMLLHGLVQKASGHSDVHRCLNLITCQNPYLDAGAFHKFNRAGNIILEPIFNRSGSNQLHVYLNLLVDGGHLPFSILYLELRLELLPAPSRIGFFIQVPLGEEECSQALFGTAIAAPLSILENSALPGPLAQPLGADTRAGALAPS